MLDPILYRLGILVAIVGGTGAGILALLSWRLVEETPFGTLVALLAFSLSGVILYHVALIAGGESIVLETVRSAMHTALALFVWLVIASHRRIQRAVAGSERG